jgi:hypothetical protein
VSLSLSLSLALSVWNFILCFSLCLIL